MNFIFFGSPDRATIVLQELKKQGLVPLAIVSAPDKPVGRKQILTPTETSQYAIDNNIDLFRPANKAELSALAPTLESYNPEFILVVAYGLIIPDNILNIPTIDAINVHYSLLPKYRGASPVVAQIINNESEIGFSIMQLVTKLDAGAVYYQHSYLMPQPIPTTQQLALDMSYQSGQILPKIMQDIKSGILLTKPQDDTLASYCGKISKTDGEVDLQNDNHQEIYLKSKAYYPWPKTYFITNYKQKPLRVVINEVEFVNNKLEIISITPAGKNTMNWTEFCNWLGQDPLIPNS